MTMSVWPNSHSRSAAQKPADPVPTTTVFAVTTGTGRPAITRVSGSWVVIGASRGGTSVVQGDGRGATRREEPSETGDVHAAVDVEHLAGRVRRVTADQHGDGATDVGGLTPARHRRQAVREQGVV